MGEQAIFSVTNHHVPEAGQPPALTDETSNQYLGYFENSLGEQAIFVYDRATDSALLYLGDSGWEHPHRVENGRGEGLILDEDEQSWLVACWNAATQAKRDANS